MFPWLMKRLPGPPKTALSCMNRGILYVTEKIQKHKETQNFHEPRDFIDYYLIQIEKVSIHSRNVTLAAFPLSGDGGKICLFCSEICIVRDFPLPQSNPRSNFIGLLGHFISGTSCQLHRVIILAAQNCTFPVQDPPRKVRTSSLCHAKCDARCALGIAIGTLQGEAALDPNTLWNRPF